MTFKEFLAKEMWDTPGKQGEAATPIRKPSDGQPFSSYARGGKPRANTGAPGGMGMGMGGNMPMMMKKKMKKKMKK